MSYDQKNISVIYMGPTRKTFIWWEIRMSLGTNEKLWGGDCRAIYYVPYV